MKVTYNAKQAPYRKSKQSFIRILYKVNQMQKQQHVNSQIRNLKVYGHQVSGSAPKFTDKSQKYIYKSFAKTQGRFYQYIKNAHIGHKSYHLSKYFPQYFGAFPQKQILQEEDNNKHKNQNPLLKNSELQPVSHIIQEDLSHLNTTSQRKQWIQHLNSRAVYQQNPKFLKLGNLTQGFRYPNIMDIKLGIKYKPNRFKQFNNTTMTHGFRINGLSVRQFDQKSKQQNGTQRFLSKYYCQQITQQHLNKHLVFFLFDGMKVHKKLLDQIIFHLKQIILGYLTFTGIRFKSSSLFIAYDAYDPEKFSIKFIDFEKYQFREGVDDSIQLVFSLDQRTVQDTSYKQENNQHSYKSRFHINSQSISIKDMIQFLDKKFSNTSKKRKSMQNRNIKNTNENYINYVSYYCLAVKSN